MFRGMTTGLLGLAMMALSGLAGAQTVMITGANSGIGLEFARQYAAKGWTVIATHRRSDTPKTLADLAAKYKTFRIEKLDVTDNNAAVALAAKLADVPIDVLINNAGVYSRWSRQWDPDATLIDTVTQQELLDTFRINAAGPMLVIEHFLNLVRAAPRGRILNISSRVGSVSAKTSGGDYAYAASKAALNIMTRALAAELAPEGIVVIAITPGWVRTEMGGRAAALSPEESVRGILSVAAKLTPKDAGRFVDYQGEDQPW
jgi:NAD(P)-dependent dehydrogenase (short-subunit alcohol dehydrogenase family)